MPALNFKSQFAAKVENGTKPHTIRGRRKHPIKPGDVLYHYTGMRTRVCRRLRTEICMAVVAITIDAERSEVLLAPGSRIHRVRGGLLNPDEIERLAKLDGFDDATAFFKWFRDTHGATFRGHLIEWDPKANAACLADLAAEGSTFFVQISRESRWAWGAGKLLEGPRDPKAVKRDGYGFTDDSKNAWPFKTAAAAKQKARIIAKHMSLPEADVAAVPSP